MENENTQNEAPPIENYDVPNIVGDIDTVEEEVEYLEKKIKIPVWAWLALIIIVSIVAVVVTANQSPSLVP